MAYAFGVLHVPIDGFVFQRSHCGYACPARYDRHARVRSNNALRGTNLRQVFASPEKSLTEWPAISQEFIPAAARVLVTPGRRSTPE
jgi:hypothetical protein